MFRNAGLVLRSVVLSLALASVFACAAEDTGKEEQGTSGSDLSKGNKHPKADASADDDGGTTTWTDGGYVNDASVDEYPDASTDNDASYDDSDGGTVEDAAVRW